MKRIATHRTTRAITLAVGAIALIFGGIALMQPLFDSIFGGGTLLATSALAQGDSPSRPPKGAETGEPGPAPTETKTKTKTGVFKGEPATEISSALLRKQTELDELERELNEEKARIAMLQGELDRQFGKLKSDRELMTAERDIFEAEKSAQRDKEIKKWFAIFQTSKPELAASVLEIEFAENEPLAREFLTRLESKQANKILEVLNRANPDLALRLMGSGLRNGNRP